MRLANGGAAIVVTAVLFSCPAVAHVPTIAGNYVSVTRVYCQPTLNVVHSGASVSSVTLTQTAPTAYSTELEFFDPHTNRVKITSVAETGSSLLLNDDVSGLSGMPFQTASGSQKFSYSNDATTVTINGIKYHAEYGLQVNGVVQYFALLVLGANDCVEQSEKLRR